MSRIPYLVHIPKCGGSWVKSVLKEHNINVERHPGSMGHIRFGGNSKFQHISIKKFPDEHYLLFLVVRNPFDLLVSHYFHGVAGWGRSKERMGAKNFKTFIESYCKGKHHNPDFAKHMFSQAYDNNGTFIPKTTIRFERLQAGLKEVLKMAGYPINEDVFEDVKPNKSLKRNTTDWREYYDEEMIKLVQEKCAKELEIFGYDFNGPTDDLIIF